jgi:hypothetical protein
MSLKLKKPLVLGDDGLPRLIRADETLDATAKEVDQVSLVNGETSAIKIGSPVYVSGSMTAKLAKADGITTKNTIGLVAEISVINGASGNIQTDGQIVAGKLDWDAALGLAADPVGNPNGTGLMPGAMYYLSETAAGQLKVTPPALGWIQRIGTAVSETVLDLAIAEPIGLN